MSKIRILPEQLANQIAAGEVVERPASVVKELVENSIDAGADRIIVEIEGSGTRHIRVIDNGEGMDEDDILLSLERHGTSKITSEDDLAAIETLGFRGEAIPSIGSVSQLTITSRLHKAELGTQVHLHYGKLTKVHEIGAPTGTTTEIRNLFGNTPARRKFLRTARTETGHIEEVVKSYALACPHITFILKVDGREILNLDNTSSLEQRLGTIMRFGGQFLPVHSSQQAGGETRLVAGFLIPPEQVQPGPARLRTFVNGRAVRDRMIVHAVTEGLRGFLMKGKNPGGLINLDLPPSEIDVNVHPAKHEVRFRQARDIHSLVSQAVARAMGEHQRALHATIFGGDKRTETSPVPEDSWPSSIVEPSPYVAENEEPDLLLTTEEEPLPPLDNNLKQQPDTFRQRGTNSGAEFFTRPLLQQSAPQTAATSSAKNNEEQKLPLFTTTAPIARTENVTVAAVSVENQGVYENLIIIGQYDDLYIFCKTSQGLLVIDQHAAHERLLYEKLRKQYLGGSIAKQTLMFPETIEFTPYQSQLVDKYWDEIEKIGFNLREFGGSTYIIAAVPALTKSINTKELLFDTLERFGSENDRRGTDAGGVIDTILATMACKAAVKAGTELSTLEIKALLRDMAQANLFSHCPHGRPVVKQFSRDDIKKWFYRT